MTKPSGKATALQRALQKQEQRDQSNPLLNWHLWALIGAMLLFALSAFFVWQISLVWSEISGAAQAVEVVKWEVSTLTKLVNETQTRVQKALESPAVLEALSGNGDTHVNAATALKQQLPELVEVEFYSAELVELMHNDLAQFGYAKASMLMQARSESKPAPLQSHNDAKGARYLMLAQPIHRDNKIIKYAVVQMPFAPIQESFRQAWLSGARVDLRQGDGRGDMVIDSIGVTSGGDSSSSLGVAIAGSAFRIATAQPERVIFTAHSLWVLLPLFLLTLLAAIMLVWTRRVGARHVVAVLRRQPTIAKEELTLAQTLGQPAASAIPRAGQSAGAAKPPAAQKKAESPVNLDRSIFRAYDIRGVLGHTLNADIARKIGHAIGSEAQERGVREIVVGRDGRLSGPELSAALIEGLRAAGCDVIDVGAVPTPVVYFATHFLNTGSGVMVTGSHNPPDYNGFKIVLAGETLSEGAIQNLYARIAENRLSQGAGALQAMNLLPDYIERITGDVQIEHKIKVVVDCGNGIAGVVAPAILEGIGCEVMPLYCDVDGNFPNHHPDPSDPENLQDLILTVKQMGADVGIAFDGDGDRLGVVTKTGEVIYPDRLLMLFAIDVLSRNPGAAIIYDVKCTGHLQPLILKYGGSPMMWKTGHSLIKSKMREIDAELAGEMSGHFFFRERWYGFDDGIYSAARLMEILTSDAAGRDPQTIFDSLPKGVSTPELKIPMPEGEHYRFIEKFKEKSSFEGARVTTIDGVRADYADGWGLVRCSNTTPCLVLRFDADNEAALNRIQDSFRNQLRALEPSLTMPF